MRRLLALFVLLATPALGQQAYTGAGEAKTVCQVWDGTDRALVDASGNQLVGDGSGAFNVIVDSGALTCSISQTGTANDVDAIQSGTWTVQPGNTANTTAWLFKLDQTTSNNDVDVLTLPSVTIGTFPDNEPFNLNQLAGNAVSSGNGVSGTGVLRVAQVSDGTGTLATVTTVTNLTNLPNEGQQTAANSISVTPDTDNDPVGAPAAAVPGEAVQIGGTDGTNLIVPYIDPCQRESRTVYRVDIVTATTTEIAAAVASEFYWICSINLVTAGANNVIIVEDDTATNCPSPTAGVSSGGTTAGEGWNFAANGGIVVGTGSNWIMKTGTANRSICIITSAGVQLSGTITYVSAP